MTDKECKSRREALIKIAEGLMGWVRWSSPSDYKEEEAHHYPAFRDPDYSTYLYVTHGVYQVPCGWCPYDNMDSAFEVLNRINKAYPGMYYGVAPMLSGQWQPVWYHKASSSWVSQDYCFTSPYHPPAGKTPQEAIINLALYLLEKK